MHFQQRARRRDRQITLICRYPGEGRASGRRRAHLGQDRRLRRHGLQDGVYRERRAGPTRGGRRQGRAPSGWPEGSAVPAGTETDLQGRQACGPIRVQHPDQTLARGLRVGGADARGRKKLVAVDPDFIRELFAVFGPVRLRRMFSGIGIFADGRMFGCAVGGLIHLKTDDVIVADFAVEQSGPFLYPTKGGMRTLRSYWRLPERLYDDPEELVLWARRSLEAARRAAARPRAAKPKRVKPPADRRAPRIPGRPRK